MQTSCAHRIFQVHISIKANGNILKVADRYGFWLTWYQLATPQSHRIGISIHTGRYPIISHPMPFVFFILICDAWEICFILHKMKHISHALHCIIKTHRQKAWDDGVAPSVHLVPSHQLLHICKQMIHIVNICIRDDVQGSMSKKGNR